MLWARRGRAGVVVVTVVGLMALLPSSAAGHEPGRELSGQILVESPSPKAVFCTWLGLGRESQGVVGRVIRLNPEEADGLHEYRLTTKGPLAELGLAFYHRSATCESVDDSPPPQPMSGHIPPAAGYAVVGGLAGRAVGPCYYTLPPTCSVDPVPGAVVSYTFQISGGLSS